MCVCVCVCLPVCHIGLSVCPPSFHLLIGGLWRAEQCSTMIDVLWMEEEGRRWPTKKKKEEEAEVEVRTVDEEEKELACF